MKVSLETSKAERVKKNTAQNHVPLNVSHKEIAAKTRSINDSGLDHARVSTSLALSGPRIT